MSADALRIFVSSPGDVGEERVMTERVVQRLQGEFGHSVKLQPILWEHEPMRATQHPQEQITLPSECDIVVCLLWSRLGTRLPDQISAAGKTGTEWEFEDAARSFRAKKIPDLLVYRKTKEILASVEDDRIFEEKKQQRLALNTFLTHWFRTEDGMFKAVFKTFQELDQFEELLERDLRKLIQDRLKLTPLAEKTWHHAPFRGLEVFDFEHAPIFFGRTRAIGAIREALVQQAAHGCAFVLVFGMSGVGKSSLVRAGVLPTITQPGVIEGVGLWRWCVFRPSDATGDLCDGLASALMAEQALPELAEAGVDARALAKLLREAPDQAALPLSVGLKRTAETTATAERLLKPPVTRLALVVDQMEELFSSDRVTEPQRIGFVQALSALARSGHVWIIGTMRSDFYPRCAEVPELAALKAGAGQFDLLPPTAPQLAQMIGDPARAAGLRFEEKPTGERLDHVLQETALRDPQALPLLEFTLAELYKLCSKDKPPSEAVVLTFAAYDQLGGMEGALARRAEEEFAKLPANVQAALPAVFRALVTVRQGEDEAIVAQPVLREVFAAAADQDALVETFIQARLFVSDRTSVEQEAMVRLAHEALLRCWPRLVQWLQVNGEFLRIRARMSEESKRWQSEGRLPELLLAPGKPLAEGEFLFTQKQELDRGVIEYIQQSHQSAARKRRRRQLMAAAFVMTLVLGTVLSSFFAWQSNQNAKARALAQVNALCDAAPGGVPGILADLESNRATVLPALRARFAEESNRGQRMRLALALLPIEPNHVRDELVAWMLQTKDPAETLLVREELRPYSAELTRSLWQKADDPTRPRAERFHASVVLASFDPASSRWKGIAPQVAEELLTANALHLGIWVQALYPVRLPLLAPLSEVFRGKRLPEHRQVAAAVLADYAADQPQVLAELLMEADQKQFALMFPKINEHVERWLSILSDAIDQKLPPDAKEDDKDHLAKRQASAAVALLIFNRPQKVWPLLKHTPDPRLRSYLIHRLGPLGANAGTLLKRLDEEGDVSIQRALILSMGEFSEKKWPSGERDLLVTKLKEIYRHAADPGLHGASEWLLRHCKQQDWLRQINEEWRMNEEQQEKRLELIKLDFRENKDQAKPLWYVNTEGQTMVAIPGPVKFTMGSPNTEVERSEFELPHLRLINRNFAIANKPVTVEQFDRFLKANPKMLYHTFNNTRLYSPEQECPINTVPWYMAAQYCRWLSERECLPEKEMIYPSVEDIEKYKDEKKPLPIPPDYLKRNGYRLPTEAEWEYSCRAGAEASRFFGNAPDLLGHYAWYLKNSNERTWPVGQKKPNDFGCFEMHGGVWNWCHESRRQYQPGKDGEPVEDHEDTTEFSDLVQRVLRGGSFSSRQSNMRCAYRDGNPPSALNKSVGLRVARTLTFDR